MGIFALTALFSVDTIQWKSHNGIRFNLLNCARCQFGTQKNRNVLIAHGRCSLSSSVFCFPFLSFSLLHITLLYAHLSCLVTDWLQSGTR